MTASGSRRPPAPTCEDWDEETELSSSDSRASADSPFNRSKSSESDIKSFADKKSHDGSDSGYSSKAGTSDTTSSASKKKSPDLKINTKTMDRERHPYTMAPGRSARVMPSPTKTKEVRIEHPQAPSRFQHEYGVCWVCDQYGYHFDPAKEITRSATAAPAEMQRPPRSIPSKPIAKEESDARPSTIRRSSSKRESRPFSMVIQPNQYPFPPPVGYDHPQIAAHGWQAPPTQMPQYPAFHHAYAPPTPLSSSYTQPSFFDQAMQYPSWAEPRYGDSPYRQYDEPAPRQRYVEPEREPRRVPSHEARPRESRPRSSTHRSSKIIEADRLAMPPPPRPELVRPSIKKVPTETVTSASRRRSSYLDDEEGQAIQAMLARERRASQSRSSQSRAPSAYRPVPESHERPTTRKSKSYSIPSGTVQVESSQLNRRRTDPVEKLEQRQAEVEDYMAKRGTQATQATDLTTAALKKLDSRRSVTPSDSGSTRSSKDSAAGRARAGTSVTSVPRATNITMDNGFSMCLPADYGDTPLDITIGNLRLSMNTNRQEEPPREPKRIERAPSEISQASRRSLTSGSGASVARTREDAQALTREVTRETYRQKPSANSSKKSSRAPSRVDQRRKGGRADDYAELDESYYFAYNS